MAEEKSKRPTPQTDETAKTDNSTGAKFLSGLTAGDKSFVGAIFSVVLLYFVKRFFDSSDKAIDKGYDVTLSAKDYGGLKFTQSRDDQSDADAEEAEADDGQNAEKEPDSEEADGGNSAEKDNEG